jgi:hypothetical protein
MCFPEMAVTVYYEIKRNISRTRAVPLREYTVDIEGGKPVLSKAHWAKRTETHAIYLARLPESVWPAYNERTFARFAFGENHACAKAEAVAE